MKKAASIQDWTALGVITGAHGVRGMVRIRPFTESPDGLLAYGPLSDEAGKHFAIKVTGQSKGQFLCELQGVSDRNDAEKLRGTKLGVLRSALPTPQEDDSFYIDDLVGLEVRLHADQSMYGTIRGVQNYGAGDIVEIALAKGGTELYAFTHATFPQIDIAGGTVLCSPPETIQAKADDR